MRPPLFFGFEPYLAKTGSLGAGRECAEELFRRFADRDVAPERVNLEGGGSGGYQGIGRTQTCQSRAENLVIDLSLNGACFEARQTGERKGNLDVSGAGE